MILLLLDSGGESTAGEVAAALGVSVRTVHREMEDIERILLEFGLELRRVTGRGIQLWGPESALGELRLFLRQEKPAEYSGEDRKVYQLCYLLESDEPVKLFTLAHALKVTTATVSNDLDELESWVRKFGLQLIRRRGYGVEIAGGEADKRRAICRLAAEHLDQSDLVGHHGTSAGNPVYHRLMSTVGKPRLVDVENTLWDMEWKWTSEVPEIGYMELLLALSVTVRRVELGREFGSPEEAAYSIHSDHRNIPGAEQFLRVLGTQTGITFPKTEILYVAGLFDGIQESFSAPGFVQGDIGLMETVYRLTEYVSRRTGIAFQSDRTLREGLLEHIDPAFRRIREGTRIRNPLLAPIRRDYDYLFQTVRAAVEELGLDIAVPDEEIGFLVMHFGASSERLNQLSRSVRALLVCASGLSSSRLLATRLAKEMPQIEVLGNVSWYEAARVPSEEYDLIISTIDLPLPSESYIKISPLLTPEESERLLQYVQSIGAKTDGDPKRERHSAGPSENRAALEKLKSHKGMLDEMISVMERFRAYRTDNRKLALRGTLSEMLDQLKAGGSAYDPDILLEKLLEREMMASQIIPETSLALFHTRSSHVHSSSLTLHRLAEPVLLEGGAEASVILLMLAPRKLSKESLEVLSEISALLLNAELVKLLEEGTENEIRVYWSNELLRFFESKI